MPFSRYARVKNNYCISYFGSANDYIVQLIKIRPRIQEAFPDVRIYIGCKDSLVDIIGKEEDILWLSTIKFGKLNFAHIYELKCNTREHPVEMFLEESNINYKSICKESCVATLNCSIYPYTGSYPAHSLNVDQIDIIKDHAKNLGFNVNVNCGIDGAGWVIGVENEFIFEAASRGIKTSLIPNGLGTNLYKKMFPCGEIFKIN